MSNNFNARIVKIYTIRLNRRTKNLISVTHNNSIGFKEVNKKINNFKRFY